MSKEYLGDISETDVQKAINMYLGRMMFRRLSSVNQAYYLGTSLFFHDDMNEDQSQLNALKKVTLEDVNRVAAKYLSAENPISIVVR
jgi:predicted Zn-dependent peptidase